MVYAFELLGEQPEPVDLRLVVWYDNAGKRPLRMTMHYREMKSEADFVRGVMRYRYRG